MSCRELALAGLVGGALAGCGGAAVDATYAAPRSPAAFEDKMANDVTLDWSMAVSGPNLLVSYRLTNGTPNPIWVVDALVIAGRSATTHALAPGRLVVLNGDTPGEVSFTLGARSADQPLIMIVPPHWKTLAAGATDEGTFTLPLPLRPWHNQGHADDFFAPPGTGVLVIEYALEEPAWTTYPADDGSTIQVGSSPRAGLAVGKPLPIPQS